MPRADSQRPPIRSKQTRLTKDLVVDAAIGLLRRTGAEKFSLRALAKELGVTPMALYRHVPTKQALLDEVKASVLDLVPLLTEHERTEGRPEGPLSERDIVERALELVRREGLASLNMRDLARALNVTPMSIYRYLPNKVALLSRMSDAIIEKLPRPPPSASSWENDFREHAFEGWRQFSAYPGLVGSFAAGPSEQVLEHMRYEHSILLASGVDARSAALAITVYHTFLLGLYRTQGYLDYLARREGGQTGVRLDRIRRYGDKLALDELLDFALDAVIAAVKLRIRQSAAASRAQRKKPQAAREKR